MGELIAILGAIVLVGVLWGVKRYRDRKRADARVKERDRIAGEK